MIAGVPAANYNIEHPQALTAPVRSLPFIPSDFSPTVSPTGTIVEMQAVVRVKANVEADHSQMQQMLEVLA